MKSRYLARFGAFAAALAAVALTAPLAQATTPALGYSQFAGCPSPEENSETSSCQHSTVKSGFVKMGSKEVPISKPIQFSGGTNEFLENFDYNSNGGLEKVKLKVPGGVVGLTGLDWLTDFLTGDALALYAVTELAGTPEIHTLDAFTLPVKVHLINAVLGNKCYVGSTGSPLVWNLITGTTSPPPPNTPITGKTPEISFTASPEILFAKNGKYVDNSFSAPGASGCTLTLLGFLPVSINGLVNTNSGLPAASGRNETQQIIDTEIAGSEVVYP